MTPTSAQFSATAGRMPRIERRLAHGEAPSRSAISGGEARMFSAIVTAVAAISMRTKTSPARSGSIAANAYATTSAGVAEPATLMTIARHRYGWTTHTMTYTSAGMMNAGAGPRKPIASMSAATAADTTSDAL